MKVNASIQAPQAGLFTPVYTDSSNKLSWSKKLPGTYSNSCVNAKGEYDRNKCTFDDPNAAYVLVGSEGGVGVDNRKVKFNAVLCVANR